MSDVVTAWPNLPLIWAALLAFVVFLYVLLDGFDLGIGILFPFAEDGDQRDRMMNSVAPVWDGNETWLVMGGVGLFAAFPSAYATMLPALYMPLGLMLTGLIFRGVAFGFRARSAPGAGRHLWDQAFHWGSLVATFSQGLVLGALVQGIAVEDGVYAGGRFDWLTPFSVTVAWSLVWGYVLLGAAWLVIKTDGDLLAWANRATAASASVVAMMMLVVSIWVLFLDAPPAGRWGLDLPRIEWDRLLPLLPIPLLVTASFAGLFEALRSGRTYAPYLWAVVLFLLGYVGLLVGIWPYLVPYALTFHETAAPPTSQGFLLMGMAVLLPVTLGYTGYVYWTFRGKADIDGGYH
jgi:cytochrome d ubiquinol oxidase subunit II